MERLISKLLLQSFAFRPLSLFVVPRSLLGNSWSVRGLVPYEVTTELNNKTVIDSFIKVWQKAVPHYT